jgi:hypothetical protein
MRVEGGGVQEMAPKWGKFWFFDPGKVSAGCVRFFGSGTNAEKDRSSGNWWYTFVAWKTKWKFQLIWSESVQNKDLQIQLAG